jgi:hypothetical protein
VVVDHRPQVCVPLLPFCIRAGHVPGMPAPLPAVLLRILGCGYSWGMRSHVTDPVCRAAGLSS